ncbi:membrane integrity-associated transporter subunit PqiC [Bordetella sp. LUAb4]|uniref:PqiC family protein n=1 Tax=Bordetella sp. LUAb4 TaxID=2843195 RepID=UPI001E419FCF|nr:PqiC family protein [Bordetella sp. LUAb4]
MKACLAVLGLALLAGCGSSPPVHYYTLTGAELPDNGSQIQAQATPAFMLEVMPVTVPPPADQPQLMMREKGGGLTPLYSERWSAPLADEVRGALADTLTRALRAPDVQALRAPQGAPVWRVTVDVQRLDSTTGVEAIVDATWRVRPVNLKGQAWQCRSISRVPVQGTDAEAAVRGLRDATRDLALTIASAIQDGTGHPRPGSAQVQLLGCNQVSE